MAEIECNRELEARGLELQLGRTVLEKVKKDVEGLREYVLSEMKRLGTREYDGEIVCIEIKSQKAPQEVDPTMARQLVPFDALLPMISIDREQFQGYMTEHHPNVDPATYLKGEGEYQRVVVRVKIPEKQVAQKVHQYVTGIERAVTKSS